MSTQQRVNPNLGIFLAILLAAAALGLAQAGPQSDASSSEKKSAKVPDKQSGKNPSSLAGAARVSTETALEDAAKQAARKPKNDKEQPSSDAVVEFHPAEAAEAESTASSSEKAEVHKSKKAKGIHGSVFGATDPQNTGTRRVGGAVGATSKGGKTSVYVQTEGDRSTTPH